MLSDVPDPCWPEAEVCSQDGGPTCVRRRRHRRWSSHGMKRIGIVYRLHGHCLASLSVPASSPTRAHPLLSSRLVSSHLHRYERATAQPSLPPSRRTRACRSSRRRRLLVVHLPRRKLVVVVAGAGPGRTCTARDSRRAVIKFLARARLPDGAAAPCRSCSLNGSRSGSAGGTLGRRTAVPTARRRTTSVSTARRIRVLRVWQLPPPLVGDPVHLAHVLRSATAKAQSREPPRH